MSKNLRDLIELEQTHFVQALVGRSDIPQGFDRTRFKLASSILAKKRMKAIKKSWPKLGKSLGCDFSRHFAKYASLVSQPKYQSALVDGRLFANYLRRNHLLSEEVKKEIERFDQKFYFKGKKIFERNRLQRLLYRIRHLKRWSSSTFLSRCQNVFASN